MKISLLESVRIPDGVTELPCDAFGHCNTLQTVELKGSTSIPGHFRTLRRSKSFVIRVKRSE